MTQEGMSAAMADYRPDQHEIGFTALPKPVWPFPAVDPAQAELARMEFERQELERQKVLVHMTIMRLVDWMAEPNKINLDLAKEHMRAL